MSLHKNLQIQDIHIPYSFIYADSNARLTAIGFVSTDLGKWARQADNNSIWMLVDVTPGWIEISSTQQLAEFNIIDVTCLKSSSGIIPAGKTVYATGFNNPNNAITIELAKASDGYSMSSIGMTIEAISDDVPGKVRSLGLINNINTSSFSVNDSVYVSTNSAGGLTNIIPVRPNLVQLVGKVVKSDSVTGVILISPSDSAILYDQAAANISTVSTPGVSPAPARGDHVHAHGNLPGGTLHGVVTSGGTSGFMSGSDKSKLDGIASGSQVVNFTNVASALATGAGNNSNFVFKTDGYGSGIMTNNQGFIENSILVGKSGDVNFNTIHEAIAAAISRGANINNKYMIFINPGTYIEPSLTVAPGINLYSNIAGLRSATTIIASDPNNDLITLNNGNIYGITLTGVTDPSRALIRISGAGNAVSVTSCLVYNCSNGLIIENGSLGSINEVAVFISGANQKVGTLLRVDNATALVTKFSSTVIAAVLPAYTVNPVEITLYATNNAVVEAASCSFITYYKTNTQTSILADNGAQVSMFSSRFEGNATGVKVGSSGSNTKITIQSATFDGCNTNFSIQSSTGAIYAIACTDHRSNDIIDGGKFVALIQSKQLNAINLDCDTGVRYSDNSNKRASINQFLLDYGATFLSSGGAVTPGAGLAVNVTAGSGWIENKTPLHDISNISWTSVTNLSLSPNTNNYIVYNGITSLISAQNSAPASSSIELAQVITGASSIKFIHNTSIPTDSIYEGLTQYLYDTRKFRLRTGLVTSQGSTNTKFSVTQGQYYRATKSIDFTEQLNATFSYFYSFGATEVPSQTNLDIISYDNAGILTPLSDGYFRSDSVYITSDSRVCVIYGNTEHSTIFLAQGDAGPPAFSDIRETAFLVSTIIVQQSIGIDSIIDRRLVDSNQGNGTSSGGFGGVTDHGDLTGLLDDDHIQYVLIDGSRPMTGNLDLGGNQITNAGNIDGVDIASHAARHNPGGLDSLVIGIPSATQAGVSPSQGTAASYSLSDHQHGIAIGSPQNIGDISSDGTASSVSRSDHVHAHGIHSDGYQHALVSNSLNGFMLSSDKIKLDTISIGATVSPLTSSAPNNVSKSTAIIGTSAEAARADHKHDVSTDIPINISKGVATEGTSISLARADHKHDVSTDIPISISKSTAVEGSSTSLSRSDHKHDILTGTPSDITKSTALEGTSTALARADHKHDISTTIPGSVAIGTTAIEGTSTSMARADHTHAVESPAAPLTIGTSNTVGVSTAASRGDHVHSHGNQTAGTHHAIATTSVNGFMSSTDKGRLDGIQDGATNTALTSATPTNVTKSTALVGVAGEVARADHKHDINTAVPGSITLGSTATEGTSTSLARADHVHALVASDTPSTISTTNNIGVSTSPARGDHAHAHGTQTDGILHAAVIAAGTSGFMTGVDKTKLDGIAIGATNSPLATVAPADITKAVSVIGISSQAAKADHKHDISTAVVGVITIGATAAEGTATSIARSDHTHSLVAPTAPLTLGAANATGSSTTPARADHVHSHGVQTDGTFHAAVIAAGASGFMTGADKTKLDGIPASAVPTSRQIIAGTGLTGGGTLSADVTVNVIANADGSIISNADDIQIGVLATDAQHGSRSGGTLHSVVISSGSSGFMTGTDKAKLDGVGTAAPPGTRNLVAGAGLTGGGDLSSDRTFNVTATDGSITVLADSIGVGVLQTDAQHGNRGGGALHSIASVNTSGGTTGTGGTAGFMNAANKTSVDNFFLKGIFNILDFGAVANDDGTHTGGTDNATAIQNAINAAQTAGGGIVFIPPGRFAIRSGLTISQNGVHLMGVASSYTTDVGDYTTTKGSWLVWRGDGTTQTMLTCIPANTGTSAVPLLGLKIECLSFDGRDVRSGSDTGANQAGIGIQMKGVAGANINDIYIMDCSIAALDLGALTAGTIGGTDTHGTVRSNFNRICVRQLDGTVAPGIGLRMSGTPTANVNFNVFNCIQLMYVGGSTAKPAIQLQNSDSNTFINIACNRGGTGTTNWGMEVLGSNSSAPEVARANMFYNCSFGPNGAIACGTAGGRLPNGTTATSYNFTFPSLENYSDRLNTENGEPVVFRGTNSTFDYGISGGSTGPAFSAPSGNVATRIGILSVVNTETQILAATIPANLLNIGTSFRIKAFGLVTNTTATSTSIHRIRIGATTLTGAVVATSTFTMGVTARTNIPFELNGQFTVLSVGATGTAIGQITVSANTVTNLGNATAVITAAVTIDTTTTRVVELTTISGATSTTWVYHTATMEIVEL